MAERADSRGYHAIQMGLRSYLPLAATATFGWIIALVGFAFAPGPSMAQGLTPKKTPAANVTEIRKTPSNEAVRAAPPVDTSAVDAVDATTATLAEPAGALPPTALAVDLSADKNRTRFTITLTKAVPHRIFTLADPYRVVIDIPDLRFQIAPSHGSTGQGLVSGYRYGMLTAQRSRIVLDAVAPVRILRAETSNSSSGQNSVLSVELVATDRATFLTSLQPDAEATRPPAAPEAAPPRVVQSDRPIIMIDPGHGGLDPGAVGRGGLLEKEIVLAVSRHLFTLLSANRRYDVRMTRSGDTFVALDQRVSMSRLAGASLFISIHADTVGDLTFAQNVRGATVYTLSDRASSQQAQVLAEKENAADARAGVQNPVAEKDEQIQNILFDLMKRETHNFSSEFRSILISHLGRSVTLAKDPARGAAFRVLHQTSSPSVLVELGYMSHEQDAQLLQSGAWQQRVAASIGAAVDNYFAKRVSGR
jgi:N-acetylmuramoyl-L-alanine amidase